MGVGVQVLEELRDAGAPCSCCELPVWVLGTLGSLQEQHVLLTTESSLVSAGLLLPDWENP